MKRNKFLKKQILCAVVAASIWSSIPMASLAANNYDYPSGDQSIFYTDGLDHGTIAGGTITAPPSEADFPSILLYSDNTKLATNNTNIIGRVEVAIGAELTINGGNVSAGPEYSYDENMNNTLAGSTALSTTGGTITVNDALVNSSIKSYGSTQGINMRMYRGTIILNNTDINTNNDYDGGRIIASSDSKIILNGNSDTTYIVGDFLGTINPYPPIVEDNGYTVKHENGVIEINGGTLKADNLRALVDGSLLQANTPYTEYDNQFTKDNISKNIILQKDGVIETKTGQIFEHGIDTTNDNTVLASKDSGKVTNDYIKYEGGTINFNDIKYSQAYLDSAKNNMANVGSTKINMLGQLVTGEGTPVTEYTVDDAVKNNNTFLNNVVVKADSNANRLVVGKGNSDETTQYSNGSFAASQLAVNADTYGIDINDGMELGLGGDSSGELITGGTEDLYITANKDSTLTLGRTGVTTADTKNTLNADVMIMDGTLNVAAGKNTVNGYLTVVPKGNVNVASGAELNIQDSLSTTPDSKLNVQGTLTANDTSLIGAPLYVGSNGQDNHQINNASQTALKFIEDTVDAKILAGENSVVSLGTNDVSMAQKAFVKTDLAWGTNGNDISSAVYIASPQNISNAVIIADKTAGTDVLNGYTNGTAFFGNNSLLMVNGESLDNTPALNGVDNLIVVPESAEGKGDGAKLYIDNAENGKTYAIVDKALDFWSSDNIVADNALLKFEKDDSGLGVTASYQSITGAFGNAVVIGDLVDNTLLDSSYHGTEAANFFNKAVNDHYNLTSSDKINALNSVANMGELGGVNHGIYSMSGIMTDMTTNHLSIATHGEQDNDIWAHFIHSKEDVRGMNLGGMKADYDVQLNGIIVGGDFYKKGKATVGAAFSYADGNIDGSSRAVRTKNDVDYYGFSLYGRIDNGDSAVLGDITYLHGSNDITQYNSFSEITASPDTDAFSIGVRAEKAFAVGDNGKFVPFIGARYLSIGSGDYTNSLGMKYDVDDQDLWLFPVGVSYSSEIKHDDWTIQPIAEVGYVFTAGDREVNQTVSLNGASSNFGFETVDSSSFVGRLGINAKSEAIDYGLSYEYQNGDKTEANRFLANVTFKF